MHDQPGPRTRRGGQEPVEQHRAQPLSAPPRVDRKFAYLERSAQVRLNHLLAEARDGGAIPGARRLTGEPPEPVPEPDGAAMVASDEARESRSVQHARTTRPSTGQGSHPACSSAGTRLLEKLARPGARPLRRRPGAPLRCPARARGPSAASKDPMVPTTASVSSMVAVVSGLLALTRFGETFSARWPSSAWATRRSPRARVRQACRAPSPIRRHPASRRECQRVSSPSWCVH